MEDKTAEYSLMLKMFPTSISPSRKYHEIFWLIKLLDVTMSMKFFCPHFPSSRDIKIHGDSDILALINKYIDEFQEHCSNSTSVLQYMVNFTGFLKAVETKIKSTGKYEEPVKKAELQRNVLILAQIEKVGFDKVIDISQDLLKIQLGYKDSCSKHHKLDVLVPPNYPDETPITVSDLPEDSAPIKSSSFKDIYNSWIKSVEAYVPAWEVLEEVDRVCWVLDPDPPTPRNLYRRIAVGSSISLQIEIEPTDPTQLPQIKFFGPDSVILPLRQKLCSNAEDWDSEDPLLINLERILNIEFPSRISVAREELKIDCWICYCYNLEGSIPSILCKTERCSACFHQSCIYEWLKALPETRTTLETAFGSCPYCKSPISVHIPK